MVSLDVTQDRNKYIGGSDIAAVMGMSRWKTPLKLWAEKTGRIAPADLSSVEAVQLGIELEEFVAQKWAAATGKQVRKAPKGYEHKDYPYMVAHIDRIVTGTDELLECKTTSAFNKDEWKDEEMPQEYILQVMWYLGITGRKVGHIAVLIGGQCFKYKQIEFDQELFDQMVEKAKEFWQHVLNDTPVSVVGDDDETLKELFPDTNGTMLEMYPTDERSADAVNTFEYNVQYLQELKMHIKEMKKEQQSIETHIKDLIKDNEGIETPNYTITWKKQLTNSFDTPSFKEQHPELYKEFTKVSSRRVLLIKKTEDQK